MAESSTICKSKATTQMISQNLEALETLCEKKDGSEMWGRKNKLFESHYVEQPTTYLYYVPPPS